MLAQHDQSEVKAMQVRELGNYEFKRMSKRAKASLCEIRLFWILSADVAETQW